MSNVRLLISRYLDGELAEDEVARLTAMLETDAAAVDALVFSSFIHAQLLHWMDQESDQTYVADTLKSGHESSFETSRWPAKSSFGHADTVALNRPDQSFITRARRRLFSFSFIATTLFIAGSISAVAYVIASRPVIVGQLTDAINCRWDTAPAGIQTGTLLKNDQDLVLLQGSAVITFASGTKLYLEGPTSLQIHSPMKVRLNSGRIAAKVPRQAIGFTVDNSLARIVDLGTAFTLSLKAEKSFQLEVFEGLVELQLNERFGKAAQHPIRVAEIHAVTLDVQSADIAKVPFEEGKQMPF